MKDNKFKTFSELYRAAYAEIDPQRKLVLLSAVKQALDEWALTAQQLDPPIGPKLSQAADSMAGHRTVAA